MDSQLLKYTGSQGKVTDKLFRTITGILEYAEVMADSEDGGIVQTMYREVTADLVIYYKLRYRVRTSTDIGEIEQRFVFGLSHNMPQVQL